jgi:hypothetical protein
MKALAMGSKKDNKKIDLFAPDTPLRFPGTF